MINDELDFLSGKILSACLSVHKEMGPGLLESVYELCLLKEFENNGITAEGQVSIPLVYKGLKLSKDFRIDILVEREIIHEVKSVDVLLPVHEAQVISYLKLANKRLGFLVNLNSALLKNGFKRFVNKF
jgi:GxxExxY protein